MTPQPQPQPMGAQIHDSLGPIDPTKHTAQIMFTMEAAGVALFKCPENWWECALRHELEEAASPLQMGVDKEGKAGFLSAVSRSLSK